MSTASENEDEQVRAEAIRRLGGKFVGLAVVCWRRGQCQHGGSTEKACVVEYFVEPEEDPPREGIVRVVGERGRNFIRESALQVCRCVDGDECTRWHFRAFGHVEL